MRSILHIFFPSTLNKKVTRLFERKAMCLIPILSHGHQTYCTKLQCASLISNVFILALRWNMILPETQISLADNLLRILHGNVSCELHFLERIRPSCVLLLVSISPPLRRTASALTNTCGGVHLPEEHNDFSLERSKPPGNLWRGFCLRHLPPSLRGRSRPINKRTKPGDTWNKTVV